MKKPWVISVVSTDYDLNNYREAITTKLKDDHVIVSAFELPDFPAEPDIHSHDSCLVALNRTDVVIVVIDKRYGGIYYDKSDVSITEEEYLTAVKNKIPCLVFVSKKTWEERHTYNLNLRNSGKPEEEFQKDYLCTHIEDVQVIQMVNRIQKSNKELGSSNWISFFDSIPDLLEKINGKLQGLSRFWIEKIVDDQQKIIMSRKTSTSGLMALGDVFRRGYYIEPTYDLESGSFKDNECMLHEAVVNSLNNNDSILVYGEAGYGKTTILAKSFLHHYDLFKEKKDYKVPFYLWLKNKGCNYHFNFLMYIEECFNDHLHKLKYPYLDISTITPFFYLDGFDEIAEKLTVQQVTNIKESEIFQASVLLTSRVQYVFRYINKCGFADKFNICIKVGSWDENKANEYIINFCSKQKRDKGYANRIQELLEINKELRSILNSPLFVTMLLWIIDINRMTIIETITSRVELFRECIIEIARRELTRIENVKLSEEEVIRVWSIFAWLLYKAKLMGDIPRVKTLIKEMQSRIVCDLGENYSDSLFEAIFDISNEKVYGTYHEQFLEYLVANALFYACLSTKEPYPEFLKYVVRPEINRYFRAIWEKAEKKERELVVDNIYQQYKDNLGDDSDEAVAKRVHAIYHISRLDTDKRKDMLNKIFNVEQHISVKLSLYFGVIKMGDLEREKEFFNWLNISKEYNSANRGYHLAYYSDAIIGTHMPFADDGEVKWEGTLNAFIRHFESNKKEHYFLRRIDLLTMLHLMETRNAVYPLNDSTLSSFSHMVYAPPFSNYVEYQREIEKVFEMVKKKYNGILGLTL